MAKIRANYMDVLRAKELMRSLNRVVLDDIEWVDDTGQIVQGPTQEAREELRFMGLNNWDFVEMHPEWFPPGPGLERAESRVFRVRM